MSQIKINDQDQKAFNKYKLISLNARNSLKNQKKTINMLNDFDLDYTWIVRYLVYRPINSNSS